MMPKIDNFSPQKTSSHSNLPIYIQFIKELEEEYTSFIFKPSNRFRFHPPKTIYYELPSPGSYNLSSYFLQLLHELGHATSHHHSYALSVDRLKIETEAWLAAHHIFKAHSAWVKKYHFDFDQDFAETQLDTYRHWLHKKATCKKCGLTMFQDKKQQWICRLSIVF